MVFRCLTSQEKASHIYESHPKNKRTLLSRIHNQLGTQVSKPNSPVEQVRYHTSTGNKVGVRATIIPGGFLGRPYPVDEAELHVSFDFPSNHAYDFYSIQWVEPEREFMVGWHQDEMHVDLGECHLQLDYRGETIQPEEATFLDVHPLNVLDRRINDLVAILEAMTWDEERPHLPKDAIR